MRKLICLISILISTSVNAQSPELVFGESTVPTPTLIENTNPEIDKLVWNKFETKNFVILSIDANQGKYLYENLESMKTWIFQRWGLVDRPFNGKCFVVCTQNTEMHQTLLGLKAPHYESEILNNGTVQRNLWLPLDSLPQDIITPSLTLAVMEEVAVENKHSIQPWLVRGMSVLNGSHDLIKQIITPLNNIVITKKPVFYGSVLLTIDTSQYQSLSESEKRLFDQEATLMCLMIRKEYGQNKFHQTIKHSYSKKELLDCLGFSNDTEFDAVFNRFMKYLSLDIASDNTPISYIQITDAEKK